MWHRHPVLSFGQTIQTLAARSIIRWTRTYITCIIVTHAEYYYANLVSTSSCHLFNSVQFLIYICLNNWRAFVNYVLCLNLTSVNLFRSEFSVAQQNLSLVITCLFLLFFFGIYYVEQKVFSRTPHA